MKVLILFSVVFLLADTSQSYGADFYSEKQVLKIIKSTLKEKDVLLVEKIDFDDFWGKSTPLIIYRFSRGAGEDLYAIFTQAKGRYDMFDYLIVVNLDFSIKKVRVIKYRSEHGGEIASKKWLKQFENYSSGELRYKKEISALSGATISAGSIVADIPLALNILKESCK